jgi:hypothetical protein
MGERVRVRGKFDKKKANQLTGWLTYYPKKGRYPFTE